MSNCFTIYFWGVSSNQQHSNRVIEEKGHAKSTLKIKSLLERNFIKRWEIKEFKRFFFFLKPFLLFVCFLREESEDRVRAFFLLHSNSENICIVFSTPLKSYVMCFNIWNEIVIEVEVTFICCPDHFMNYGLPFNTHRNVNF